MIASSTLTEAIAPVIVEFSLAAIRAASDATALLHLVHGLADGNDYGRYFFGQDPLVTFEAQGADIAGLITQGALQLAAVLTAAQAARAAADDASAFGPAAAALAEAVRLACADPGDAIRILSDLAGFSAVLRSILVPDDPLGQELYLLSRRAVLRLRLAAAASLVTASADYQPTSQQDAALVRDQIADLLDQLGLIVADLFDDVTAAALEAARVAVVQDLTKRGADLAPIVIHNFGASLPSKVLAYRLYEDATRAGDLLARNDPPHPSFMPLTIESLAA